MKAKTTANPTRRDALQTLLAVLLAPGVKAVRLFGTFDPATRVDLSRPLWDDCTWDELAACLVTWQCQADAAGPDDARGCIAFNPHVSLVWGLRGDHEPTTGVLLGRGWSTDRTTWCVFLAAPQAAVRAALAAN